ncbi:hypothetical protein [Paenibacillus tianjinensis]|uniref:Uncharacterized protein n=1 Tax=Paenibacillus tianjinensis TaxID=2810347 RepID=A0ABX7LF84_9BACL|nr:hypothetical protein [Paenibacillus tianjinensis]QSF45664.1 hypothetical protein JRJ22_03115 [Paenibacillus tianjinensis]
MDKRFIKAHISWKKDPSKFPVNEWMRDIVVHYGEIKDKILYGDTWTVLVRITRHIEGTWDTYADVAFIVDEAPWELLETGYRFNLWAGKDIAIVTII